MVCRDVMILESSGCILVEMTHSVFISNKVIQTVMNY